MKRNIIGVGDPKKLIIKIDSKKDLTQIASNIDEGDAHENSKVKRCGIAAINDLQLFAPFIEDDIVEGTVKSDSSITLIAGSTKLQKLYS